MDGAEIRSFDALVRVEDVLEGLRRGGALAFGDRDEAQAWLIDGRTFEELARARDWVAAEEALAGSPDDPGARLRYDEAAALAGDVDLPGPLHATLVPPDGFMASLSAYVEDARSGGLQAVAIGRGDRPDAVLVGQEEYQQLINAQLRWRQSPPFLAALDPAVHKPIVGSRSFDLDEHLAQNPVTREIWERIQERKRRGGG
jgi:hypothetical protein